MQRQEDKINEEQQKIQQDDSQIQQITNQEITPSNLKPFNYQLMEQNSIKQDQFCYAIAVNKDCSILIAGCKEQIKVFEFNQAILKQLEILSEHSKDVNTLNFLKRSDQFISGSDDNLIIIWARNPNNSWVCQQKLNGHTSYIMCLTLNNNEDVIASGDGDSTIKLWYEQNEWLCKQTIKEHINRVLGLSFNEQQNKLISCGQDMLILVMEQSELNKQWIIIQKIELERQGIRLCFIDNSTFTVQSWGYQYMHIFEMNSSNKLFSKTKDIPVKEGPECTQFPQQYIKSKCILVNKNSSNVNLIRKQQNGEFTTEQTIEFGTHELFGCMTDDGQYLITWGTDSKEFQIREYKEQ
ncbi:unnamed protein product [Paramecium primaurelia]|uniref:WD40-repeat-containing domain n=1 Tax=Paramecium primaurelia TaxID=5886 RepID=A0A8S1QHR5_PARPR|nr:unnamed protein product [Paramecium primaurelia]